MFILEYMENGGILTHFSGIFSQHISDFSYADTKGCGMPLDWNTLGKEEDATDSYYYN